MAECSEAAVARARVVALVQADVAAEAAEVVQDEQEQAEAEAGAEEVAEAGAEARPSGSHFLPAATAVGRVLHTSGLGLLVPA